MSAQAVYPIVSIPFGDVRYPALLGRIANHPAQIYVRGESICLSPETLYVAVVGTRTPSAWGSEAAYRTGRVLARMGVVVVSGLALGCDTQAHRGCLDAGGTTVAVLAHGLDRVYPAVNTPLAENIINNGGCLLSNYAIGIPPHPERFVARDVLQSALSHAVIVVETSMLGGTMYAARACAAQCRRLIALQHPDYLFNSENTRGNRWLIKQYDAVPIKSREELRACIDKLKYTKSGTDITVNTIE